MPEEDDAVHLTVDNQEQKKYAEYLRDEMDFGLRTIRTRLVGMKRYKTWRSSTDVTNTSNRGKNNER